MSYDVEKNKIKKNLYVKMGRHKYRKSYCAPCVPCNTQVGNGLLNIAGIAAKANGRLDPIGKESLELFDALFPVVPVTGGVQPATESDLYDIFTNVAFNVTYYNCATCAPEYACASSTICAEFTKYTNYVISTGMDVLRLTSFCFPETQGYLNYTSGSTPGSATYALYQFNVTLNSLLEALTLNCTGTDPSPLFACAPVPVTPQVMPPAVKIPAGAPIQIKPHDAKNKTAGGGCSGFASATDPKAGCACAGEEAPQESKQQPEKKKGRIANIFSKLRKKVSNKSSDA